MAVSEKHTPGPWAIDTATRSFEVCTIHGMPRQLTEDGLGQGWVYIRPANLERRIWSEEENQANANLIAAAPDLLNALEQIVIGIGMGWDLDGFVDQARAAIAKAKGGEP